MSIRRRVIAATAAVGLAAATAVATSAAAGTPASAGPSGTGAGHPVTVSSTKSTGYAKDFYLDASSKNWVIFAVLNKAYAEPSAGGPVVTLPDADVDNPFHVTGDLAVYSSSTHNRTDYYDLATKKFGIGSNRWQAAAPDGGVYSALDKTDGRVHGYEQNAATGSVTDLGVLTGFTGANDSGALADESGVVFFREDYYRKKEHEGASYIAFEHPGTATPLQTHNQGSLTCLSLASNALGCATAGHTIYRVPLDGSAAQAITIAIPKLSSDSGVYSLVFVTASRTFWGIDYDEDDHEGYDGPAPAEPLRSVPADAPHAKPVSTSFTLTDVQDNVVTNDRSLYFGYGSSAARGGIYRLSSDHQHRVLFHLAGGQHFLARGLALGAGQAVFEDDSLPNSLGRLRSRLFRRSGNTVTLGRIVNLAPDVDDVEPVFTSGSRVLATIGNGDDVVVLSVTGNGNAHAQQKFDDVEPRALSGNRVILLNYTSSHHIPHAHMTLVDLTNGHRTDLSEKYGVRGTPALFGDYLAYGTKDGSIHRLDLVTHRSVTLAGPTRTSRGRAPRRIVEWGDYVAWDYSADGKTFSSHLRNARTMAASVALPSNDSVVGASADGVSLRPAGRGTQPTLIRPWTSDRIQTVYASQAFVASSVAVYTADVNDSDSPGLGTVRARPLTHAADRPRSLGNPFAGAGVRQGHTWHFDLPTSAALTSCTVAVRRLGRTIRTLACAQDLMNLGEASVSWNGKTGAGHRAGRGVYHVVVSAANADGTLLAADGSHATTGATVTVR